ncbi:hypothetical protein KFD70_06655 [Bacillus pfraonensis]|uniref:hypothetical protein n=1 Tax=Bacillus TaxID=1386 RepID=UPI002A587BC5|nr:hypothetical protein [Bacillus pseudomycoides]
MSKSNQGVKQKRRCMENGVVKTCKMCKACAAIKELPNEQKLKLRKKHIDSVNILNYHLIIK